MSNMMEDLLMGGDSSSGESDAEDAGKVQPTSQPPQSAAPSKAPPVAAPPAPQNQQPSQSELSMRLKSLYSPAAKQRTPAPLQQAPPAPAPAPMAAPTRPAQVAPPPRHQQPPQQPPPQPQSSSVMRGMPPSRGIPQQPGRPQPMPSRQPTVPPPRTAAPDPLQFEPTPLHAIKQREAEKAAQAASASSRRPVQPMPSRHAPPVTGRPMTHPPSTGGSASSSVSTVQTSNMTAAEREQQVKRQKERFLMFTRVLMKYLEQKDPQMHQKAKAIIKDCADKNKKQVKGYESVTASMQRRLKEVVGEPYWKRAQSYLDHFLVQKERAKRQDPQEQKRQEMEKFNDAATTAARRPPAAAPPQPQSSQVIPARRPEPPKLQVATSSAATSKAGMPSVAASKVATPAAKKTQPAKRRTSLSPAGPTRKPAQPVVEKPEAPPREYNEFMEMVDNAVTVDWTTAGLLLGHKSQLALNEEQRQLLYGDQNRPLLPKTYPLRGWGRRNVVSSRVAWARVRLREHRSQQSAPVVGGGLLTLPGSQSTPPDTSTAWVHEQKAEEDLALTMLSQGAEIYLRSILEKAIACARQRQNLDGIRLWHQQHIPGGSNKPPLSVRLGCDVGRQVAQASGNAAMVCKRMEEALDRQPRVPSRARELKGETLLEATSMSELALRPKLAKGVEDADYQAKRSFEVYGGKDTTEPPLGRVPKKARIETVDFEMGLKLVSFGRHRPGFPSFF